MKKLLAITLSAFIAMASLSFAEEAKPAALTTKSEPVKVEKCSKKKCVKKHKKHVKKS